MTTHGWRTSRYSGNGLDCVEVAPAERGMLLRDTKHGGAGPVISFTSDQWTAFVGEVAAGAPSANGAVTVRVVGTDTHVHAVVSGVTLRFTASEWAAFHAGVRDGEFDQLLLAALPVVSSAAGER